MDEKKAQGRKRKRRTDRKQIKQENEEPTAKRLKITLELPAELLLEIFKSLTPTDLIMVGRVCRFWNECASGTSCWRLYSTCYVEPTGISWEVDRYFREHDGFLLADVKYIAPNEILANRNVHSFELSHKGEYLARYEISVHIRRNGFLNTTFIRFGTLNILEDFVSNDPESNNDIASWAIEARIVPAGDENNIHYQIAFSLYFNELTLLSSLRSKRKFPKQAMLLNKIEKYPSSQFNLMYHVYWNITNHPCEPVLVSRDIFGDSIDLFDHQYRAINWMLYIEGLSHVTYSTLLPSTKSPNIFIDQSTNELVPIDDIEKYQVAFKPKGGILADDYGLGKTISAICLVLADKKLNKIAVDLPSKNGDKFTSNATLVICPALLVDQWQIDIVQFSELTTLVISGPNQILNEAADILLLSDRLVEEYFKIGSPLFNTTFRRIILDESHILLKHKQDIHWSQKSLSDALLLLSKTYGWCLSTTPFPDEYESTKFFSSRYKSLTASTMEFLEFPKLATVSRWDESGHLKDNIDTIRYNQQWTMMSTLIWCTKRDQLPEFNMSSSTSETVRIELTPFERAIVESQEKSTAIAVMTGIICFHKPLDTLKEEEQRDLSKLQDTSEGSSERISDLESIPFLAADPNDAKAQMVNLFGSKLATIITWVKENIIEKNKKCIMFSKYTYFLRYISYSLDHYNIDSVVLDTSYVDQAPENQRLKDFRQAKHGVLLLQFDTKLISGLHFKDVEYIVPLDVLNEALTIEDSNYKLALGRVTSIGAGPREIKRVKFVVNHDLDEVWSDFTQNIEYVMARWMNLL